MREKYDIVRKTSQKIVELIVVDTIISEKGDRAIVSGILEKMKGIRGYATTQKAVWNMFGAEGTSDPRVSEMSLRKSNVSSLQVQEGIINGLDIFCRSKVDKSPRTLAWFGNRPKG